jgi:universal stress protein A
MKPSSPCHSMRFVKTASLPVKKILAPIDFSEHSERTLGYAVWFAKMMNASLILFHAFELPEYTRTLKEDCSLNYGEQRQFEMAIDLFGKRLHKLAGAIEEPGVEVTTSSCIGAPYELIIKLAKDREVDLIVIGSHGYTGLTHFFLGSTAEHCGVPQPGPVGTTRPSSRLSTQPLCPAPRNLTTALQLQHILAGRFDFPRPGLYYSKHALNSRFRN